LAQTTRPVAQPALVEHGGGFDHFQRVHRLAVAFGILDPAFRLGRAGHALHLVNRGLVTALFKRPACALQSALRLRRRGAFAAHHEQLANLALERSP
jgi:hypothetical protein